MLEAILEKLLINTAGPYLNGIDKKNLKVGIWSGDIVVGNITVKPEVFKMLGLPMILKYSFIGKLKISLSYTSLASKPVEVFLEDVYVILQPIDKNSWAMDEAQFYAKRMDLVEALVQTYLTKIVEKAKKEGGEEEKEEDQGMIGKLTAKIIDNIQVTIRNIHIRFENPYAKRKYACGITLDEIVVYTTNEKGEKQFVDRTLPENKLLPMHKVLAIKNFGIYWASGTAQLYGDLDANKTLEAMKEWILKDTSSPTKKGSKKADYIFSLSATCKLTQKNKKSAWTNKPDFTVTLQVAPIDVQFNKNQLEDVVKLLEFMSQFEQFKLERLEDKKNQSKAISSQEIERYQEQFRDMFTRIYNHPQRDEQKGDAKLLLTLGKQQDVDTFKKIITVIPEEELSKIVKKIVKDSEREKQLKAFDEKSKPKQGWMGSLVSWGSKPEADPKKLEQQRKEELAKIDKLLQDTLGNDQDEPKAAVNEDEDKNLVDLTFIVDGANVLLSYTGQSKNEEGVNVFFRGFETKVNLTSKTKTVELNLKEYGLSLQTKYFGSTNYVETHMIRRLNYWMPLETTKSAISITYQENPKGREEGMYVDLDLQTMEITYRPAVVDRLTNFFAVSTKDEQLKSQALQQLEKVQDKASQAASGVVKNQAKKHIKLNFNAPIIVLPFLQNADLKSECWVLNLGNLKVNTKDAEKHDDKYYEMYLIELSKTKFQYYPSHGLYLKTQKSLLEKKNLDGLQVDEKEHYKRVFDVMEEFNFVAHIHMMMAEYDKSEKTKTIPRMNIEASIPSIKLNLKPAVYTNLLKTGEFMSTKDGQMDLMEQSRAKLLEGNTKLGSLYVQEKKLTHTVWTKYDCVFTKAYIYFFKQPTDDSPAFSYYIKEANIFAEDSPEKQHAFKLENKYNKVYLAAESENEKEEWIKVLKTKVNQYALLSSSTSQKVKSLTNVDGKSKQKSTGEIKPAEEPEITDHNLVAMNFSFQIKYFGLSVLLDEERKLFDFTMRHFAVKMKKHPAVMHVNVRLETLDIQDYLFEYTSPNLKMLMTSNPPGVDPEETEEDLIEVVVFMMEKTHPEYAHKKTAMGIQLKFGYFFMNFKPETLKAIMQFFIPAKPAEEVKPVEVKEVKPHEKQEVVITSDKDEVLIDLAIDMKTIGLRLVHKTSHICMAELALNHTRIDLKMQPQCMEVQVKLGDIQLFDTTNYPDTIDSNLEYQNVRPYKIIGALETSKDLIEVKFGQYDPAHPKANKQENIYSNAEVLIRSIKINHLQQPVLRALDYLTGQLLPSLSPGGPAVIPKLERATAEQNLASPKFMGIKVTIESPIIELKPRPDSKEYLEIRLGDMTVNSERVQDVKRFADVADKLKSVYCERYNLKLKDMCIYKVVENGQDKPSVKTKLAMDFTFAFYFEKPLFVEEYTLLYGESQDSSKKPRFDNSNRLEGSMTPVIFILTHSDYLLLMRCLNFNIAYDDGMDRLLVSDYEVVVASQNQPGTPMLINLVFENFSLLALKDDQLPFAMLNLHLMTIGLDRDASKKMKIDIGFGDLNGSFFDIENDDLIERKMLGSLDEKNSFKFKGVDTHHVLEEITHSLVSYAHKVATSHANKEEIYRSKTEELQKAGKLEELKSLKKVAPLTIEMTMNPNGNKNIKIGINYLRTYLATSSFLTLLSFIGMDDSVNPPPPKAVVAAPVDTKNQPPPNQGSMEVNIEIDDIIVAIPSAKPGTTHSSNVLAIRGDISVLYKSSPEPTLANSISAARGKRFERAGDQCSPANEVGCIGLGLKDFEIFVCDLSELLHTESFKAVHKRNMILPFSLSLYRRTHKVLNQERRELIQIIKNEINMDQIVVRVSYQDTLLVNNSVQFHLGQMGSGESKEEPPKQEVKVVAPEPDLSEAFGLGGALNNTSEVTDLFGSLKGDDQGTENIIAAFGMSERKVEIIEERKINEGEESVLRSVPKTEPQPEPQKLKKEDWEPSADLYAITSKGIKIVLINDAEGRLVPVLELTVHEVLAEMQKLSASLLIKGKIELSCAYFNSLPSRWEPILEQIGLDFQLSTGKDPKMAFALATNENFDTLNINISEHMISTIFSTMNTWKTDYNQKASHHLKHGSSVSSKQADGEQDIIDYISPYTIVNQTGFAIELQADEQHSHAVQRQKGSHYLGQVYRIENAASTQYKVESDIEEIVKETLNDLLIHTNKIRVRVDHPSNFQEILGIDIDKPNVVAYPLKDESGKQIYKLVSEVKVEKGKKIIVLSSPYRIKSQVEKNVKISLESGSRTHHFVLNEKNPIMLPIDCVDGTIGLHDHLQHSAEPKKIPMSDFFNLNKKLGEINIGSTCLLAELEQQNGVYEVTLMPPFQIKNCCAVNLNYKLSSEAGEAPLKELRPQQKIQEIETTAQKKVYLQVKAGGYKWSDKVLVHSTSEKDKVSKEVVLKDDDGRTLTIEVFLADEDKEKDKDTKELRPKKFFLYTKTCIINETPYDLEYFTMDHGKKVKVSGNKAENNPEIINQEGNFLRVLPKVTLMNETKSLIISRKDNNESSKEINVATVGNTFAELLNDKGTSLLELGVNMALTRCDKEQYLMTKIITISPRYILINQTEDKIEVKFDRSENILATLDKDKRTPLYWSTWQVPPKDQKPQEIKKNICVRLVDSQHEPDYWTWSNPFDITGIGAYNFKVSNKDNTETKFLKATVYMESSMLYVTVDDEKTEEVTYKIRNDCNGVNIRVYQSTMNPASGLLIKPGETIPWAWPHPNKKKEVAADFLIDNAINYHSSDLKFSFDALNQVFEHEVPFTKDKSIKNKVYAAVSLEGNARVLKFYMIRDIPTEEKRFAIFEAVIMKAVETVTNMDVEIGLKGLGISLISNMSNKVTKKMERREALYILFRGIEVRMVDTTESTSSQLRIKYLNIDNNVIRDTTFPVLLTPTKPANLAPNTKEYFFDLLITKRHTTEINFYETIQFLLNETSMSVDGPFIEAIMEAITNLTQPLSDSGEPDSFNTVADGLYKSTKEAQRLEEGEYLESKFAWKTSEVQKYQGNLFIQNLTIHPLFFNLSFQLKRTNTAENAFILLSLLTGALGTTFANLDRAPLTLKGIQLHNVFDSQQAITQKIISMYKDEVTKNALKLLGSLDIVGNPVGLFNNISTGVVDLFEKPMEGFLKGPLEGGKGLITGAGSFVKNTVSGTFNSISKITGSLATGVSNLTLDDEYLEEREKFRTKRPHHIGEGLWQGASALVKGVFYGVTGVFVKPVQGVAHGGCKGLAKGTYQGVSGLVAKPVAGVLDAASKTAEGIKNTATFWDQKTNEERLRKPRPFYGNEKVYRNYRAIDAEIVEALRNSEDKSLTEVDLISSVDLFPDEKDKTSLYILAVTYGPVVYWSAKKGKIIWSFYPKDVETATITEGEIVFNLKKPAQGEHTQKIVVKNPDQEENKFVYTKVLELKEFSG